MKWLDLEYGEVPLRGKTMRFATTGSSTKKRLRTLFSKEPITLASIDTFAEGEIRDGIPAPEHIKIDVDGLEHRVIAGMLETLRRPQLKAVLIEINFDNPKNLAIIETMEQMGWRFSWHQLRMHRRVKIEKIKEYQARGIGGLNYIFYKMRLSTTCSKELSRPTLQEKRSILATLRKSRPCNQVGSTEAPLLPPLACFNLRNPQR